MNHIREETTEQTEERYERTAKDHFDSLTEAEAPFVVSTHIALPGSTPQTIATDSSAGLIRYAFESERKSATSSIRCSATCTASYCINKSTHSYASLREEGYLPAQTCTSANVK